MIILLLAAISIGTGIAIRILRGSPRMIWGVTLVGTLVLTALLPLGSSEPMDVFGRLLALETSERIFLWPAVVVTGMLALFGPLQSNQARDTASTLAANSQGAFFFFSLAPCVVALGIDSFPLAAVFWAIGLISLVLVSEPRREGRVGGSAQFLFLTVVAAASLLLSNRFLELYPLTPENQNLARTAFLLLVWGLGLLLTVAPLHIWIGPLADEMPFLGIAFLVGVAQPVGLWLLIELIGRTQWLIDKSPLLDVLLFGGVATVLVGALSAMSERRHGRLLAFVSLVSLGNALIGLGLGTKIGIASAALAILDRGVGVTLLAAGLTFIRAYEDRRWRLVGAFSVLGSAVALSGLPPLPGFAADWALYRASAVSQPVVLLILVGSAAAVFLSLLKIVRPIFDGQDQATEESDDVKVIAYLGTIIIVMLVLILLLVGLFPQWVTDPIVALLASASYLK